MTHSSDSGQRKLTANVKAAGCAAKIGPGELDQIVRSLSSLPCAELLTGFGNFEDAAVYKLADNMALVQTIDFFPPVVDDPFLFGRIAAVNALSDVYAMGGRPIMALNVFCFPTCDYPLAVATEILRGGSDAAAEAGCVIAGGHSIQSQEPIYGLSVTGLVDPARMLTNSGAKPGDILILTKPVGTGVGLLAMKGDMLSPASRAALLLNLTTLNNKALDAALAYPIHAATDITGFGLIGHVHEMAAASGLKATIDAGHVAILPDVHDFARQGFVPAGAYGNRKSYEAHVTYINDVDEALTDLFYDPQTAGGLLFACTETDGVSLLRDLQQLGLKASRVGRFESGARGALEVFFDEHQS